MSSLTGLQQRVLIKCGGFSTHLANHVGERIDGDPLWGSRFDLVNPTAVVQTHLDFLENGAQIILSNTYQSSVEGFMKYLKLNKEESIQLMRKSVQHAKEAKTKYMEMVGKSHGIVESDLPLILGSVGPYGAMLHDGSEYNGSYTEKVSKEEIQNWHRTRIDALLAEGVNGLAVETIPCQMEAEAVTSMLLTDYPSVKFWISFQCKDEIHLAHGENFANAAKSIWELIKQANAKERIFGIGVNCVNPKFVVPLFKSLHVLLNEKDLPPLVVYSNRGETYDLVKDEWTGQDKCIPLETYVADWIHLGAKVIGGCCRVYPTDIYNIRKCIDVMDISAKRLFTMSLNRILVKDGGFGTQITVHVGEAVDGDPLWSARFNATDTSAVINTHLDFLQNGADIILTNTYQTSVEGYMKYLELDADQSIELIKKTVCLAQTAKEIFLTKCNKDELNVAEGLPMIIASIGPYGAHLHDGSEYSGDYADYVSSKKITDWHRVRIDACLEAKVDALAIETIPCQMEAEALVEMLCDDYPDVKFWVAFQCKDEKTLAHGEDFVDAALSIWNILKKRNARDNCLAIGVNCVNPKYVTPLFKSLNGERNVDERIPLVAYPNSGEVYDVNNGWMGMENCVSSLGDYVSEWAQLGAKVIGGCCRTYAHDIRHIKETVEKLYKSKELSESM